MDGLEGLSMLAETFDTDNAGKTVRTARVCVPRMFLSVVDGVLTDHVM